jgi:hypothetical protein
LFGGLFIDKGGTGTGSSKHLNVFPVFEKTDVFRSRGLERRYVSEQPTAVLRAQQSRAAHGGKRIERKRTGSIEETWI